MAVDKSIKQDDWLVDVEAQRMATEKSFVDVGREGYDLPEMLRSLALDLEGSQGDALRKAADEIARLREHMELRVAQVNEYEPRMRQAEEEVARLREREAQLENFLEACGEILERSRDPLAEIAKRVRALAHPEGKTTYEQEVMRMEPEVNIRLAHPEGETNE